MSPEDSQGRTSLRAGLLSLPVLLVLLAAACADALPVAPPAAREQPTAAESDCGWLRWGGDEATVADWFAAHPDVAVLHWWDAGAREFREFGRAAALAAPHRQLLAGTPFWPQGEDEDAPRIFSVEQAADDLIRLRPGVNLVPWLGKSPAVPLDEAIRWIAPELAAAAVVTGDGSTCRAVSAPEWRWEGPPTLAPGDVLALTLRREAIWLQPWAQPPQLLLGAGVEREAQDELWREWAVVSGYMASRHGAAVALRAIALQPDHPSFVRAFELLLAEELDSGAWPIDACGGEIGGWIGLIVGCQDPIAFDHEYVHALQHDAATGGLGEGGEIRPLWLVEGMAMYLAAAYRDAARHEDYLDAREWAIDGARAFGGPLPLDTLETWLQWRYAPPLPAYAIGLLAAEWLAAQAGDDALFLYMRRLQRGPSRWRDAFDVAFGLSVEDFYEAFSEHSETFERPRPHRLSGQLLDPEGAPVGGMRIYAYPRHGGAGMFSLTGRSGGFAIEASAGSHRIAVQSGSSCTLFGYYSESGGIGSWIGAALVEASARRTTEITIRLPVAPTELRGWTTCAEPDGEGWVQGRVLDADGRGVPNVFVLASEAAQEIGARAETDADGKFAFDAAPGDYQIAVGPADGRCVLWGMRSRSGELVQEADIGIVAVGDAPVRGVEVRLPAPPAELETYNQCW